MAQARRVQKALHASPEGGTEDDVRTPLTDAEGSLFPETENNWCWCMAQARRVQKALCASPEGSTEDNVCTPLTRVLCLGLPCGRRFSVNGPLRSRPLPQVIDVAGAQFRPSPSATVRGLVDPDCRSTTVSPALPYGWRSSWEARYDAVFFCQCSTSLVPGFALGPQPLSVAFCSCLLQGIPVWGSR